LRWLEWRHSLSEVCQVEVKSQNLKSVFIFFYSSLALAPNETVLLAMAYCQAKTDESAEIIILSCTAETLQPRAIEAI